MAVSAAALADALADIVGAGHVLAAPDAVAAHAIDGSMLHGGMMPRWVVRPGSVEEVSGLLALATAEKLAVAPRGSGSSVDLGSAPARLDLVLDCGRLAEIVEYVAEDMVATVGAGLSLAALAGRLAGNRQRWPVDPFDGSARSVGGVLATNASGPLRFRYGTARDVLLGVRFVQADGVVTWGGAKVVKSVTGYDIPKLLVGSLGTLGVIAEATLRLHPIPAASRAWLLPFASLDAAGAFLAALGDTAIEPARVLLLNESTLRAVGRASGNAAVAVSVESVEEAVLHQGEALGRLAAEHGSVGGPAPDGIWTLVGSALAHPLRLKLVGEIRRLARWLGEAERLAAALGLSLAGVGEAGSGVLWLGLDGAARADSLDRGLLRPLRERLAGEGGSLVVERAPRAIKPALDVWGPVAPETLAIMRRLKGEFDPQGILNPGRFVGGL